MARKPRSFDSGLIFHITGRGNRKSSIFHDDADKLRYLELLVETREKFPFILHSYCLMTNHIHLLIEMQNIPLSDIMKMWHSLYAIYFNTRHELVGHVFQGRYKAEFIDSAHYFLKASKYIHQNPLEANLVENLIDYPWSSYPTYVLSHSNSLVDTSKVLSFFPVPRWKNYQEYVESDNQDEEKTRNLDYFLPS